MKIITNDITFNSKIKLLNTEQFSTKLKDSASTLQKVDYPWTIETSKVGKNLYTDRIMDCIVIVLKNTKEALLAHLGIRNKEQAKKDNVKEFDINNIEEKLLNQINLKNKSLQGIIFGGIQLDDEPTTGNSPQLNQIKNLLKKYKIPFSIIGARKDVHFFGRYSLLFSQDDDTLYITNNLFNSKGISGPREYKEMELEKDNSISYVIYEKIKNKNNYFDYKEKRVNSSVKEYFESQFRQVELNNEDKIE